MLISGTFKILTICKKMFLGYIDAYGAIHLRKAKRGQTHESIFKTIYHGRFRYDPDKNRVSLYDPEAFDIEDKEKIIHFLFKKGYENVVI